jgi:hypothetical protein
MLANYENDICMYDEYYICRRNVRDFMWRSQCAWPSTIISVIFYPKTFTSLLKNTKIVVRSKPHIPIKIP